jgi:hypothetical protein
VVIIPVRNSYPVYLIVDLARGEIAVPFFVLLPSKLANTTPYRPEGLRAIYFLKSDGQFCTKVMGADFSRGAASMMNLPPSGDTSQA